MTGFCKMPPARAPVMQNSTSSMPLDLSSISADEFGFRDGSTFFSSSKAKTLFDAQADAFRELSERNSIPPNAST